MQSFLPGLNLKTVAISHGGELAKGKRKTARPVDPKQALHVVLRFSRELSGGIAMLVTGAAKGRPQNFWDGLLFTRIVRFGRDFEGVGRYVIKNLFESARVSAAGLYVRIISKDGLVNGAERVWIERRRASA